MSLTTLARTPLEAIEHNLERPVGRLGRIVGHVMSVQHRSLTSWTLRLLPIPPAARVLDVGCGSGMAIKLIADADPSRRVDGVDRSAEMVAMTKRRNAAAVAAGRVRVIGGDALDLGFPDATFDAVTAIETFYFWDDPIRGLAECHRVLRPGGWLAVTLEMTKEAAEHPTMLQRIFGRKFTDRSADEGLSIVSGLELTALLREAGFASTRFAVEPRKSLGWLCAMGQVAPVADVADGAVPDANDGSRL